MVDEYGYERYKIHWIDVRTFKDDDNDGYVYGICEQDAEGTIHHIQWYKKEEERDTCFRTNTWGISEEEE